MIVASIHKKLIHNDKLVKSSGVFYLGKINIGMNTFLMRVPKAAESTHVHNDQFCI